MRHNYQVAVRLFLQAYITWAIVAAGATAADIPKKIAATDTTARLNDIWPFLSISASIMTRRAIFANDRVSLTRSIFGAVVAVVG